MPAGAAGAQRTGPGLGCGQLLRCVQPGGRDGADQLYFGGCSAAGAEHPKRHGAPADRVFDLRPAGHPLPPDRAGDSLPEKRAVLSAAGQYDPGPGCGLAARGADPAGAAHQMQGRLCVQPCHRRDERRASLYRSLPRCLPLVLFCRPLTGYRACDGRTAVWRGPCRHRRPAPAAGGRGCRIYRD